MTILPARLVIAVLLPLLHAKGDDIGEILQVRGSWCLAGQSVSLLSGQSVAAGALIRAPSARRGDFLEIVLVNGSRLSASCPNIPCSAAIQVPDSYIESSLSFKSVLAAVKFVLLNQRPEVANAFGATSSRGTGLQRAELALPFKLGEPVALPDALSGLPEGLYNIELTRASDSKFINGKSIRWHPGVVLSVAVPEPGSYVMLVRDRFDTIRLNFFLLLCAESDFAAQKKSFDDVQQLSAQWTGANAIDSAHYFLRAYLLSVANRP